MTTLKLISLTYRGNALAITNQNPNKTPARKVIIEEMAIETGVPYKEIAIRLPITFMKSITATFNKFKSLHAAKGQSAV